MASIIPELASSQHRRDEEPNKLLGKRLVESRDLDGIKEAVDNLVNDDRKIRIDCLAVLEQVGLLEPELIENYMEDFYNLALSNDNRQVWAAMINIALIADRKPDHILENLDEIINIIESGSVITQDNGIKILASAVASNMDYHNIVFPYLMQQLKNCRTKSVAQYAESIQIAVRSEDKVEFLEVLTNRMNEFSPAQKKRIDKVINRIE